MDHAPQPVIDDDNPAPQPAKRRPLWARALPLLIISAGFVAFFAVGLDEYLSFEALGTNRQQLLAWEQSHPVLAAAIFMTIYAVAVAFSVPGAIWLTIAGGFLFGLWLGTIYVVVAATIGACGIFIAARYAFADLLRAKVGNRLQRMERGFRDNGASYLLHLRLVPIYPFWLVNLGPAFFGMPLTTFSLWTLIGIIPGTFVYVWVGTGVGAALDRGEHPDLSIIFDPEIFLPLLALGLLSLLPIAVKRFRASSASDASDERPPKQP